MSAVHSLSKPISLRVDLKLGQVGGLTLGDTITKVLTYVQMNV